jgi:protein arginine kinase activator
MAQEQKCAKCDKPAQYKIVKIQDNMVEDYLLCAEHAQRMSRHLRLNQQANILSMLQKILNQQTEASQPGDMCCDNCHLSYAAYQKTLLLGCSDCYRSFEDLLVKDLRRFHGAVSQEPDIAGEIEEPEIEEEAGIVDLDDELATRVDADEEASGETAIEENIDALRLELQEAIELEDFERAAQLRDAIRSIEEEE